MDITGIGAVADAVNSIVSHFFPDKTQEEKDKLALEMQGIMNAQQLTLTQVQVDDDEAKSTDPLQHWRGGLGWVCTAAYAWQFVLQPVASFCVALLLQMTGQHLPSLPVIDATALQTLTLGMLGLAGAHVYERVKGAS